ncbi:hypothetical protein SEEE2651_10513, partial [Salmonella enterica subsp. enterica serovar Enteritidis str. 76-2651]
YKTMRAMPLMIIIKNEGIRESPYRNERNGRSARLLAATGHKR